MAKNNKKAAYVEYAKHHRKKYEKKAGKKLTVPELVTYANPDWQQESEAVKSHFKLVAKGEEPVKTAPRHETSCQRMDTEARVVTSMSVGEKWNNRKEKKIMKGCQDFEKSLVSVEDLINQKIGIIDFNGYVKYLDGLTVPAEFSIVLGSLKEGINPDSIYSELLRIEPFNRSHLRDGFRHDLKVSCEREHGIDIDKIQSQAVELEFFCAEVSELIKKDTLLLCRKEDVDRVLGSWYFLRNLHKDKLPKIQLITLEYFVEKIVNYLITHHNRGDMGSPYNHHTLTDYFSKTFFDTDQEFRCDYHNSDDACDKPSCTKKNTKKYFYLLIKVLADFLPEVQLEDGKHFYTPPNSKIRTKHPQAAANTPRNTPSETANTTVTSHHLTNHHLTNHRAPSPEPEILPRPRTPQSFSARNKMDRCDQSSPSVSSCSGSSSSGSALETDELPRRPKSTTKQSGDEDAKSYTKSDLTYQPVPVKCQSNGVSAQNQGHCLPGLRGRGRGRAKSSTPSPPPESTSQGYAAVKPGVTNSSVNGCCPGKLGGVTSYGRGQRFAAAQVKTVVSQMDNLSLSD